MKRRDRSQFWGKHDRHAQIRGVWGKNRARLPGYRCNQDISLTPSQSNDAHDCLSTLYTQMNALTRIFGDNRLPNKRAIIQWKVWYNSKGNLRDRAPSREAPGRSWLCFIL